MQTDAVNVKRLALPEPLWHGKPMKNENQSDKAERLARALRANLRRRKGAATTPSSGHGAKDPAPAASKTR